MSDSPIYWEREAWGRNKFGRKGQNSVVNTLGVRYLRQVNGDVIWATKYVALDLKKEIRDGCINLGVIRVQFLKSWKYMKSPRKRT